ncbi:Parvalbumin [Trema orientale]|uniref:Parvalbumin n=1 Tax=Trema orientale TaxID=63057 RepID=A0A2P5G1J5_TREOI|nr:Parvalbumin [Trema orientale]
MGLTETCSRLIGDLVQVINGGASSRSISARHLDHNHPSKSQNEGTFNDSMSRALITVFGMQNDGKIHKEKARRVVEKLGLIRMDEEYDHMEEVNVEKYHDQSAGSFDLPGDDDGREEVAVEAALGGEEMEDCSKRSELLRQAFKIFDENGNGFIEAVELKRVLECLGLDCGWDMDEIEKMLRVVDLNLDGKVDFGEFELMMGVKSSL